MLFFGLGKIEEIKILIDVYRWIINFVFSIEKAPRHV